MKLLKLFLTSTITAGAISTAFAVETKEIPRVTIPSIKVSGQPVSIIQIGRSCFRAATAWEQLNNGLDKWTSCDDLQITPVANASRGLIIQANDHGVFEVPVQTVSYTHKMLKTEVICLSIEPVSELVNLLPPATGQYAKTIKTRENLLYCSHTPTPDYMPPGLANVQALSLENYAPTLSQAVEFTAEQ